MSFFKKIQYRFIDRIYDQVSTLDGREGVEAPELYVAVLILYNNVNKFTPGSWMNPPKKRDILRQMEAFDYDKDRVLNRDEFRAFCNVFFPDLTKKWARNFIIGVFIIPMFLGWAVTHMKFITIIVPDPILSAFFLAFLNSTGFLRLIDEWIDGMFRKRDPYGYAQAYPYGYPNYPGGAYPPPGYAPPAPPQGVPSGTATGFPAPAPGTPAVGTPAVGTPASAPPKKAD